MGVIEMIDPATGERLGELEETSPEAIERAMVHARKAFRRWGNLPLSERMDHISRLRRYIVEHADELAATVVKDTGKVHLEALMTEILLTVDFIKYYEKRAASILKPKKVPTPITLIGRRSWVEYRPMGVVAVISPWNYPFQLAMIPAISALVVGNAVLIKPSEVSPLTGLLIEKVFRKVGFPEDVVQVIHGGKEVGERLIQARPDKIFFTGSVASGKKVMAAAAEHLIPVDLELGGKDPMIVFADADLRRAANAAVWGAFTNAGQTCMAVERLYVESSVYETFVQMVKERTEALRLAEEESDVGSMTFPRQLDIVEEHLADAKEKGAKILCGGRRTGTDGLHFEPTVLVDVDHSMRIMSEETFGPVLPIMPFDTEQEAIRLANDTPYGLNSSIWTKNRKKARRVAARIEAGNVCINDVMINMVNPGLPYGGVKWSGIGRYHGPEGLLSFCHRVSLISHPGRKKREINWYPYSQRQTDAIRYLIRLLYGKGLHLSMKEMFNLAVQFLRRK
ncbi:acyl-CoA reductase-like NAD-dependent aldehyde dehydrogenase [Planifilum fimeticola]|uniref:Aldehyde dehydrogenase n=1 Tax=Planifilum fimeticola TaxID=201975 RepID=A0A2T0LCG6_9BACL|nr:aldehyde dehydrogenase family protein [Planifilum fimeticola]PRX39692.1 acyl-CoA reductase-like NAD-dependent aldehyde dehydrogenase [Planifilum fimeticola]